MRPRLDRLNVTHLGKLNRDEILTFKSANSLLNKQFYNALSKDAKKANSKFDTYCLLDSTNDDVIGFFSIANRVVFNEDAKETSAQWLNEQSIPCVKLEWVAVDEKYSRDFRGEGDGYGRILLYFVYRQVLADYPETELLCLESKESAIAFYKAMAFEVIPESDGKDFFITSNAMSTYMHEVEKALA
ncbi:MAG: hypothetical protein LBL86_12675 [Coriobacteriales bacterium]|jgi:ribosomal protein S18 acetylase RimI-like enzyme|nr:hypothetical protein [Coriobacteriales bacterium]